MLAVAAISLPCGFITTRVGSSLSASGKREGRNADRTHQAMFDAVWKTGELAVSDPASRVVHSFSRSR